MNTLCCFGRARIDPAERTDRARYIEVVLVLVVMEVMERREGGDVLHDLSISSLANGQINQTRCCVSVCVCVFLVLMHCDALQLSVGRRKKKRPLMNSAFKSRLSHHQNAVCQGKKKKKGGCFEHAQ